MFYINILILTLISLEPLHSQDNAEYIILTTSEYEDAATIISNLHSKHIDDQFKLTTEIILLDTFDWYNINDDNLSEYIRQEVLKQVDTAKYLLLLGNETTIPPIYILASNGTMEPSDDFFSCPDDITDFENLQNSVPDISTGRISIDDIDQANIIAEKLYSYMVEPTFGSWRSEIGLIADDESKNGYSRSELNHTINSNNIYQNISNSFTVSQFYGVNYESVENSTYITKPQMTSDVLDYINKGVSLINYIGHGSETTLGTEKIIDMNRDLNHICSLETICQSEKKPAIWVVGTCSFGSYDNSSQIMSEKLLFSEVGAISLVTTSRGIGDNANSFFLNNLFSNINDFALGNNSYRLGDLIRHSKRQGNNTEYLFHLLGDPALVLPFPKVTDELIDKNYLIDNSLGIMENINPDLQLAGLDFNIHQNINLSLFSKELEFEDSYPDTSINYILRGDLIYNGEILDGTCVNIPQDIEDCINCSTIDMTIFSDENQNYNGSIQILKDIPLYTDDFNNDNVGPDISLNQGNSIIENGSIVNKDLPIEITVKDEQGVNLMTNFQHNIRYWFNNELYVYNLNSNLFEYSSSECGQGSAVFFIPEDLQSGKNIINIEAWDNANNRTLLKHEINIQNSINSYVSNIYNFPNPFEDLTFFTFYLSKYPSYVEINIYTINGENIKTIKQSCDKYYNVIAWDGKKNDGTDIGNGPYLYSFDSDYNGLKYHEINKIAKLK